MREELASRRTARLEQALDGRGLDLLLVSGPANVRYLCGFAGTNGLCLVGKDLRLFITDFRYVERARSEVKGYDLKQAERDLTGDLPHILAGKGIERLGFDDRHLTVSQLTQLKDRVPDGVELVAAGELVENLRAIKDDTELEAMRDAAEVADSAIRVVADAGLAGRTERQVARQLAECMRDEGAEDAAFPVIVAAGKNGAQPHAEPLDVEIEPRTLVVIDFGARVDGYCSDCTRTFATGSIPDEGERIYKLVLEAQEAALAAVKAKASYREVDAAARELISAAGYGDYFGHGTGHGVGLEVHEGPTLSTRSEGDLAVGNVVTVEPGIYLPGRFGVRIEDMVAVTKRGRDVMSGFPKKLTVVD